MSFCKNCGAEITGAFCSSCGTKADCDCTPKQKEDSKGAIGSLCCLRAGLSVVSNEYDNVKKQTDILKDSLDSLDYEKIEFQSKLDSKERIIKDFKYKLERENTTITQHNKNQEYKKARLNQVVDNWEKNIKKSYTKRRTTFITFISMFAIGLPVFILIFVLSMTQELDPIFVLPTILAGLSCGVGFWGTLIMLFFVDLKRDKKKELNKALAELEELEKTPPQKIKSLEEAYKNNDEYQACITEIAQINNQIDQLVVKYNIGAISDNAIKSITNYAKNGGRIYKALVDIYSSTLAPRDWEHIDLIIYFLDTGRADSLKEALQQVDLLKNADKINKATKDANASIRSIYSSEAREPSPNFISCASSIKNALDLSQNNDSLSALSNEALQEALEEKHGVPSNTLLNDVNVIKDYAEDSKKISNNIQTIHSGYGISLINNKKSLPTK
ncbi:MAG: hypothetical protein IJA82_01460 [Clostridia bacterium]|nr:hypothetical protein [Clostridia bacterium]